MEPPNPDEIVTHLRAMSYDELLRHATALEVAVAVMADQYNELAEHVVGIVKRKALLRQAYKILHKDRQVLLQALKETGHEDGKGDKRQFS